LNWRIIIGLCLLILAGNTELSAQYNDRVWTLQGYKNLRKPFKKWRADLQFDGRVSTAQNQGVRIGGAKLGLEYRRVHRFGIGVYGLSSNIVVDQFEDIISPHKDVTYSFSYLTMYYERVLLFTRKLELSTTFHLGAGNAEVSYTDLKTNDVEIYADYRLNPVEASFTGYFHLTYWISVGGGYGYRHILGDNADLRRDYSSDLYILKARIRLLKLARSAFNKDVKNEY
jgi:hypothetical protein